MGREPYWDWVKGVSILAVIAIHSFGMAHLAPWEVWFTVIGRQFVNFAVPLFLAVSGWFHGLSASPRSVAGRLRRLWPPYVLWTAVFVVLFRRHDLTHPVALLADFLGGRGIGGIGYFVIVLTQMILLMPFIARIGSVRGHVAVMALLTPVGLALTYGLSGRWEFPWSALPFIVWYPCYHLGYLMGRFPDAAPGPRLRPALLVAAVAMFAAAIVEAVLLQDYSLALAVSQKNWLNQRTFRVDALVEHATAAELQQLIDERKPAFYLAGIGGALLAHVPLLQLLAPTYTALVFIHLGLTALREQRRERGVLL